MTSQLKTNQSKRKEKKRKAETAITTRIIGETAEARPS
jgi:hypothetical protein